VPRDAVGQVEIVVLLSARPLDLRSLLEGPRPELLARYPWAAAFLAANPDLPRA